MSAQIRFLQLNIENIRHLERISTFLSANTFDVVCFQELREQDIPLFEEILSMKCFFAPMMLRTSTVPEGAPEGVGIFTNLPIQKNSKEYYWGNGDVSVKFDTTNALTKRNTQSYVLVWCDVVKDGEVFRIASTHFTWTPNGQADDAQREDTESLFKLLENAGEFVITGDFNAPRGRETFTKFAERYTDNIPPEYTTSIDGDLHRDGPLELMVDAVFSTSSYKVSEVKRECGLSDHCGFTGIIEKV